jgi:hypothetical protein
MEVGMVGLRPFADDATALSIDELKIENGRDRIALYGSLDVTRDQAGLRHVRELKDVIDSILRALESYQALPDAVAPPQEPKTVKNPFG